MIQTIKDVIERGTVRRYVLDIAPVPKPRMTRSDKWKDPPRACVKRYWKYKDELNIQAIKNRFKIPEANVHFIFHIPMPKSWSNKKKLEMIDKPHQQKPDTDNLIKAIKDALCKEDSHIWDERGTKVWASQGYIEIFVKEEVKI